MTGLRKKEEDENDFDSYMPVDYYVCLRATSGESLGFVVTTLAVFVFTPWPTQRHIF